MKTPTKRATRRLAASIAIATALAASSTWAGDRTISENYTLTDYETVDGVLTVASGVTVDLKGYHLTVQGLAGDGTITNSANYSSDLTSPDTTQTHVTWVTKFGTGNDVANGNLRDNTTTPRNLFNDSELVAETNDNDKRILVEKANLPLAVTYDFGEGEQKKVGKYRLYMTRNSTKTKYYSRGPKAWTFEGSNDNATWTSLDSKSDITWAAYNASSNPYKEEYVIGNEASYRYYRITFTSSNDGSFLELNRLEYFSSPELHVAVAAGESVTNSTVAIAGSVKVVKDGEGEFAMAKDETYTGGTVLAEGTLALTGTVGSFDWSKFTFGTDASKPVTLRVGEGATLSPSATMSIGTVAGCSSKLVVDGGTVSAAAMHIGESSGSVGLVEVNGGTLSVPNDIYMGFADNSTATLTINGGTVEVGSSYQLFSANASGSHGTINLNGGILMTRRIAHYRGSCTINFNGGTLQANAGNADFIKSGTTVNVGADGGTIDSGNFAVLANAPIVGTGAMTFKGGGSITLGDVPAYTGGTVVEAGTTLKLSAAAMTALAANPVAMNIPVGGAADGTVVFEVTDSDTFTQAEVDAMGVTGTDASRYALALAEGGTKVVVVDTYAGEYVWNGGSSGASWKASGNWSKNGAPGNWYDSTRAVFEHDGDAASVDSAVTAASVTFRADATVSGSAALAASEIVVSNGVSATVSAPTAGVIEKTGPGTLTLSQDRTDAATTLSEGTLALAGTAALDWSKFTFGTDASKPVTLRIGETATLANIPSGENEWHLGTVATSTVYKAGGDWSLSGSKFSLGAPGALASFYHEGGTITTASRFAIGDALGRGYFEISGGTIKTTGGDTGRRTLIGNTAEGTMVVKSGGNLVVENNGLFVGVSQGGVGVLTVDNGGTVSVASSVVFNLNSADSSGTVNLKSGGVLSAHRMYRNIDGLATFNFDGGTLVITGNNAADKLFSKQDGSGVVTVTVSENGGTIDNGGNANSSAIANTITGAGGLTFTGTGTTRVFADQSYLGTTTVSSGTTLSVTTVTFAGPVAFAAGSILNVAAYTAGVVPLSASVLTLPAEGTVGLTLNGGAFPVGVYSICSVAGVTAADGAKFAPSTGCETASWKVVGDTLVLTVGTVADNYWTGFAGDGKMSTPGNWAGGTAPTDGEDVDFSSVTVTTRINADIANATFGAVTMGSGPVIFTNDNMKATSFSDLEKVAVAENSTVTLDGDLVFGMDVESHVCRYVFEGGKFVVTGKIIATPEQTGNLYPCENAPGWISAKGLVNNAAANNFYLVQAQNWQANWMIGEDGISGSRRFFVGSSGKGTATIKATADFSVSAGIIQYNNLVLEPDGHKITLGTNVTVFAGGIYGGGANGLTTVKGPGKVVVNYNVTDLTSNANSLKNAFRVADGGTLAIVPGANPSVSTDNNGTLTVNSGATLEVAESGTVAPGGNLTLADGAALAFNFTENKVAPVLDVTGKTVTVAGTVNVKIAAASGIRPVTAGGKFTLTSGGKFAGVTVSLDETNKPDWALGVSVENGNVVLDVRPLGTIFLIK